MSTRREFLGAGLAYLLLGSARGLAFAASADQADLSASRYLVPLLGSKLGRERGELLLVDPGSGTQRKFDIRPAIAHSVALHPLDSARAIVLDKWGKHAAEVDLRDCCELRALDASRGREFYGHGAYSLDAKLFYAVETHTRDAYDSVVVVRDAVDMKPLAEFPTYGFEPHDLAVTADGKTLVVSNHGNPGSNIAFIDIATQKLLRRIQPANFAQKFEHFSLTRGEEVIVCQAITRRKKGKEAERLFALFQDLRTRGQVAGRFSKIFEFLPAPALIASAGKGPEAIPVPAEILAQMKYCLSVAVDAKRGQAALTHPMGGLVTFWDYEKRKFLGSQKFGTNTLGVAFHPERREYAVSIDDGSLAYVSATDWSVTRREQISPVSYFSSHVTFWPGV